MGQQELGKWQLKEVPKGAIGFVYKIDFLDGASYIGKKNFYTTRKRRFGKKEASLVTDKRKKLYEMVTKESNWRDYNSSSDIVKEKIESGISFNKSVLQVAYSVKELTYLESKFMFKYSVLEKSWFINDNIFGKFFREEVSSWEERRKSE